MARRRAAPAGTQASRLIPPAGGAVVRMYRIGHGDCFLLAFAGKRADHPAYVLIDCGYKPGSPSFIKTTSREVTENIKQATGGHIDVVVITHEHQDHVNGFTEANFRGVTVGQAWFAWTEDPEDDLARQLRRNFNDKLIGLLAARNQLSAASSDPNATQGIDTFLELEIGGDDTSTFVAPAHGAHLGAAGGVSMNKNSMRLVKDRAKEGARFLRPHESVISIPGAAYARVFALGPPRDAELLKSLEPQGPEEFHLAFGSRTAGGYLAAAARALDQNLEPEPPFAWKYCIPLYDVELSGESYPFLKTYYGFDGGTPVFGTRDLEVASNADFRRIDNDWLMAANDLAIDMNNQTNNSSLALAFELSRGGKVLLFAADAQRGNWISWAQGTWRDGSDRVTAKDLFARAVLYKVGHHGSHNATLNGELSGPVPSLNWMGLGDRSREFMAMITAVRKWAKTQKGWDHPLKAIKDALKKKCSGRVLQTDTELEDLTPSPDASEHDWNAFKRRTTGHRLYFDCAIEP